MSINQPLNQKRLTNIAILKVKSANSYFEIACFPNTIANFRNGIITDMEKVLQSRDVQTNASQGKFASEKTIVEAFPQFKEKKGKLHKDKFLEWALINGEVQEGEMERKAKNDHQLSELIEFINEHLIDINTGKQVAPDMVRKLLKQLNFKVMTNKSVKASALYAISLLVKNHNNLQRTFMKVKIELSNVENKEIEAAIIFKDQITDIIKENYNIHIFSLQQGKDEIESFINTYPKFTMIVSPHVTKLLEKIKLQCNKLHENLVNQEIVDQTVKFISEDKKLQENIEPSISNNLNIKETKNKDEFKCTTCKDAIFKDKTTFREHYKSEWHKENVKRKSKNLTILDQEDMLLLESTTFE